MDNLTQQKIDAEMINIEKVLEVLHKYSNKNDLSELELAGLATYMHNFYNGVENIVKQTLKSQKINMKDSPSWHRDLLLLAKNNDIISNDLFENLLKFLSFRHFLVHSYSFILDAKELKVLQDMIATVWLDFKSHIQKIKN